MYAKWQHNQSNADIQIKTIEQLHIISDKLNHLYHSLPYHVEFGARRHFFIDKEVGAIFTPEQQRHLDKSIEAIYRMQYEKDFAEMKKKHPTMSNDEIDSLIEEQEQKEEEIAKKIEKGEIDNKAMLRKFELQAKEQGIKDVRTIKGAMLLKKY